jgi:hypothetical protein
MKYFNSLFISFETVWKYLTLTGTIWAQFPITILSSQHVQKWYSARTEVRD